MSNHLARQLAVWVESPTPPFEGRGEVALAIASLPLTFIYKVLDSLYGANAIPGRPWLYILLHAAFTATAFSSVFWLATPPVDLWLRRQLATKRPLGLAVLPSLCVAAFLLLLWLLGLPELHTQALARIGQPWSRLPLLLFLALAGIVLSAGLFGALTLVAAASPARSFGLRELGCIALATLPFLLLQEQLPILWCFTTPVAVLVMIYGSGLGREHFNFSFLPRSRREAGFVLLLMVCGLLLFLLVTLGAGTISYTGGLWQAAWFTIYDSLFTWLLVVGISEEIIFRCGVLTLLVDYLRRRAELGWWERYPRLTAVLLSSLLFALAHLFRGATLIFLAFLASLLYGLSFVAGKSLFGPVLLHGYSTC